MLTSLEGADYMFDLYENICCVLPFELLILFSSTWEARKNIEIESFHQSKFISKYICNFEINKSIKYGTEA